MVRNHNIAFIAIVESSLFYSPFHFISDYAYRSQRPVINAQNIKKPTTWVAYFGGIIEHMFLSSITSEASIPFSDSLTVSSPGVD